jgi:hypothetical protein
VARELVAIASPCDFQTNRLEQQRRKECRAAIIAFPHESLRLRAFAVQSNRAENIIT